MIVPGQSQPPPSVVYQPVVVGYTSLEQSSHQHLPSQADPNRIDSESSLGKFDLDGTYRDGRGVIRGKVEVDGTVRDHEDHLLGKI